MPVNLSNALQVSFPYRDKSSDYMRRHGQWTGPASYATGGEVLNYTNSFGLGRITNILFTPFSNGAVIILARFTPTANSPTAGTVKYFDMTGAEIANGTDLSTYTAQFEAIGR